jgi:hypothetical protein
MTSFMRVTGKAPSNASPPSIRVVQGPYVVCSDPIYLGFTMAVFGASACAQSAIGFWLVAPTVALFSVALVFGYEAMHRPPLRDESQRSLLSLPEASGERATMRARWSAALHMVCWIGALEILEVALGGVPTDTRLTLACALFAAAPFFTAVTGWTLRRALIGAHVAMVAVCLASLGAGVQLETPVCVVLAACGGLLGALAVKTEDAVVATTLAIVTLIICLGLSGLEQRTFAFCLAVLGGMAALPLHHTALRVVEAIANSWSAVRIGSMRVINYAWYAFAAAGAGGLIFAAVVGAAAPYAVLILAVCVVVSAGLWGQLVEFSGKLARPFGYYGALLGAFIGVGASAWLLGLSPWLLGAGLAMGAPVIQAIGRLRCLVQGCCHGARCAHGRGIVYRRQESRVLRIAGLGGVGVHPTPLYSIYANAFTATLLSRLYDSGASQTLVIAVYLTVSGALRFIEEAYRGEPQTPLWNGLKLYQWLALAQALAGVGLSVIASPPVPVLSPIGPAGWATALVAGIFAGFAMGIDFPSLRSRFSQLTPTDL